METGVRKAMDFSLQHTPLQKLFDVTQMANAEKYRLPEDLVQQYWEQGFINNHRVLTEEQCAKLLHDYDIFLGCREHEGMALLYEHNLKVSGNSGDSSNVVMHCSGQWRVSEMFHDLAFLPSITVPVSQLLVQGQDMVPVRLFQDQLFAKPARHGKELAWHQDFLQWTPTLPIQHITVHIALDEQTEENGALAYVPGSHRWRQGQPLELRDFKTKDMYAIKEQLLQEEKDSWKEILALLKSGECSFHHPLSVHGSFGNRSGAIRRAAVLNYMADGVVSDSDEEILPKTGYKIPVGRKMEGQFFPVVYPPPMSVVSPTSESES